MQSDYFRLCYIATKGGGYVDADDAYSGRPLDASEVRLRQEGPGVGVVRIRFALDERAVEEHVGDADGPELADEGLGLVDEVGAPVLVPLRRSVGGATTRGEARTSARVSAWPGRWVECRVQAALLGWLALAGPPEPVPD